MLHRIVPKRLDVITIQEPYLDHFHNTHANQHWYTVYPREHFLELGKMRSTILMNKSMAADVWTQIELSSSDITAVQIQTRRGSVLVVYMYNDNANSDSML